MEIAEVTTHHNTGRCRAFLQCAVRDGRRGVGPGGKLWGTWDTCTAARRCGCARAGAVSLCS